MDDPVVSGNSMPMRECRNEMVALVLTGAGGHLGWAENSWRPLSACWADRAVAQFFRQLK
jgi:predicted alpha/beta-fold hydrolase